jgi:hypothetical protein
MQYATLVFTHYFVINAELYSAVVSTLASAVTYLHAVLCCSKLVLHAFRSFCQFIAVN